MLLLLCPALVAVFFVRMRHPASSTLFPSTTLFRSARLSAAADEKRQAGRDVPFLNWRYILFTHNDSDEEMQRDRKSTRLNSSHLGISYAVFCLKKKKRRQTIQITRERTESITLTSM